MCELVLSSYWRICFEFILITTFLVEISEKRTFCTEADKNKRPFVGLVLILKQLLGWKHVITRMYVVYNTKILAQRLI